MKRTIIYALAFTAVFFGAADAQTIPQRLMTDLMHDFDLKDFQAAGIAGSLARETGNFRYLQEDRPMVKNSRGGYGYPQWTDSRREAFEGWAGKDADLTAYDVNYGYMTEEFNGEYKRVIDKIRSTDTLEQAATVFTAKYLKPNRHYVKLDERIAYAAGYMAGDFSGAGCQSVHVVTMEGRTVEVATCDDTNGIFSNATIILAAGPEIVQGKPEEPLDLTLAGYLKFVGSEDGMSEVCQIGVPEAVLAEEDNHSLMTFG